MSEFKVGDKVYLECEVTNVDMSDSTTYRLRYKQWYDDAYTSTNFVEGDVLHATDETYNEAYNEGLNDAWELGKKIMSLERDGGYSPQELTRIFGYGDYYGVILKAFTPQEALAKVKQYEERNEIKVGDVVRLKGSNTEGIVTRVTETNISRLFRDGSCSSLSAKEDFQKTGKHYNSIDEFMRS